MLRGRALLLAGVGIGSVLVAGGQEAAGVLDVERRVRIAIGEAGAASLVRGPEAIPGLPADPAVRALAAVRLSAARGVPRQAFPRILRVLRHRSGESGEVIAALYRSLVHYGPGQEGRVFLAEDGDGLHRAARALDLAHGRRCDEAERLLGSLAPGGRPSPRPR
ncbi:MAG: hypothetical protein Q9Q13_03340 [Acidobacteriota bacterium]|nr:hypothetical protein [Acidobacteriota bacterium]